MFNYLRNRILIRLAYRIVFPFNSAQEIQSLSSFTMSYENLCTLQYKLLQLILGTCIDKRLRIAEDEQRLATVSTSREVNGIHQHLLFVNQESVSAYQLLRAVFDS